MNLLAGLKLLSAVDTGIRAGRDAEDDKLRAGFNAGFDSFTGGLFGRRDDSPNSGIFGGKPLLGNDGIIAGTADKLSGIFGGTPYSEMTPEEQADVHARNRAMMARMSASRARRNERNAQAARDAQAAQEAATAAKYAQAVPLQRTYRQPPAGYRPGIDPEFQYFDVVNPTPPVVEQAAGGPAGAPVNIDSSMGTGQGAQIAGGGIAALTQGVAAMNEKDLVAATVAVIQGAIPEEQGAPILAQFVQTYGEDALRQLVSDVQSGRTPQGSTDNGKVQGPGDGMTDQVPATMPESGQDVLLSDGEFVVPADVVSGLGNGSTDAGAQALQEMMGRVRTERTGTEEQPKQIKAGGLLPA